MDYEPLRTKILARSVQDKKSGCIVWRGAFDVHGFGRMNTPEGVRSVHRIIWLYVLQQRGEEIEPGMLVYHNCGNRLCVNAEHLYEAPLQEPRARVHSPLPAHVQEHIKVRAAARKNRNA